MAAPARCFAVAFTAAALFMQGTSAQNSAGCKITSSSTSRVEINDAVARAWLDIGSYVCGKQAEKPRIRKIDQQVSMVARAFAEAVAEVSATCTTQGNARVQGQARAQAEARAVAYGEAISRIFADSGVCKRCTAAVDAISRTSRELVAEATAEAWIELFLVSSSGESNTQTVSDVSRDIQETVEDVLAGISGTIRSGANDGCSIDVINEAQVGDYFASCELVVSGDARIVQVDGIATAGADARSYACGDEVNNAETRSIARATARALAEAVAEAEVYCEANGGESTRACGLAESNIEAVASAQAEAFAEAFASAQGCGCDVSNYADAAVFEKIWVDATASSYAETCALGMESNFASDFEFAVAERIVTATAEAIATAVTRASEDSADCTISIQPCVRTGECAGRNRVCRGPNIVGVLPCCDLKYHCVRRNELDSRCRRIDQPIPAFYEGTIEQPTVCPDHDTGLI